MSPDHVTAPAASTCDVHDETDSTPVLPHAETPRLSIGQLASVGLGYLGAQFIAAKPHDNIQTLRAWRDESTAVQEGVEKRTPSSQEALVSREVRQILKAYDGLTAWPQLQELEHVQLEDWSGMRHETRYEGMEQHETRYKGMEQDEMRYKGMEQHETRSTIEQRYKKLTDQGEVALWAIWRDDAGSDVDSSWEIDLQHHTVRAKGTLFPLDRVFPSNISMADMFCELSPWVDSFTSGTDPRVLLFLAFGYSGLGKTRVMTGDGPIRKKVDDVLHDESLASRTIEKLLQHAPSQQITIYARCIDIFQNQPYDGLVSEKARAKLSRNTSTGITTRKFRDLLKKHAIKKQSDFDKFVQICVQNRKAVKTLRNDHKSSRSHQLILFDLVDVKTNKVRDTIVFADLAGEEGKEVSGGPAEPDRASIVGELQKLTDNVFLHIRNIGRNLSTQEFYHMCNRGQGLLAPILGRICSQKKDVKVQCIVLGVLGKGRLAHENAWTLNNCLKVKTGKH